MKHVFKNLKLTSFLILIPLLQSCAHLNIKQINSNNHNERIRYLVLHYTTIDYQKSVRALTRKDGVSSHYLIPQNNDESYLKNNIEIVQLVKEQQSAWHAGKSYWQGLTDLNDQSIGIELVYKAPCVKINPLVVHQQYGLTNLIGLNNQANPNRICTYPEFDQQQIDLLILLIQDILKRNPDISAERIIGHADITPNRRTDPGPKFPWHQLYKAGIGTWYEKSTVTKYSQLFKEKEPSINLVQTALKAFGYGLTETGQMDSTTINTLTVFQMHYRPWQVNGKISVGTVATLFALIEKYRHSHLEKLVARYKLESKAIKQKKVISFKGQFNGSFPQKNRSSRQLINDRKIFKGYKNKGHLWLTNNGATSAKLSINGKAIAINQLLNKISSKQKSQTSLQSLPFKIDISHLTKNGFNSIKVENILPAGSSLLIEMPFPKLTNGKVNKSIFSKDKLKKIDALINQEIKKGFPGATLLIAQQGKIIKQTAYGYSSRYNKNSVPLKTPTKMTTNTLFDLASNTKIYATNYAIMKLASENLLDVNQPIKTYLPEYQYGGRETRLVKDLLTHTAGYPSVVDFHNKNNILGNTFYSQNKSQTQKLLIENVPFKTGRNIKMVYSDVDYMLLGTLIERITGMPLDEYVEKEIYQPLGLTKTIFNPLEKGFTKKQIAATELQGNTRHSTIEFENIRHEVIHGEVHDEKAFHSMKGVSGHAGLFSTAKETAILASVILNRGGYGNVKLFEPSQMDQFLKPSSLDITMGLGWRRAGNGERAWQFGPYASPFAIGHTGWTGTVTIIDPYYDLIIVLLTNKKHTPMIDTENGKKFAGDTFETGQYGSIISLVYEAFLEK